jgi:flagellar hook-associated protein 3 FlgL
MRISTSQIHRQGTQAILAQQAEVAKVQRQLSSGNRILSSSDDPVASARLLGLHEQAAVTEQHQRNLDLARGRLSVGESLLGEAGNALQRVRELTLQAHNAPLSDSDRQAIAQEVRQLHGELLALANTRDGNGEYLFAGFKTHTEPFVLDANGGVIYQGDGGQRLAQIGQSLQIAVGDSGAQVFQQIANGNGSFSVAVNAANLGTGTIAVGSVTELTAFQAHSYRIVFTGATTFNVIDDTTKTSVLSNQTYSEGQAIQFNGLQTAISGAPATGDSFTIQAATNQDIFFTLGRLINVLETPAATPAATAQLNQSLDNTLVDLDQGLEHLSTLRGRIGARLNTLDNQEQANRDFNLHLQEIISAVGDLDYAEAASRLSEKLMVLEAAQQSFLRVQDLSLFKFLR